MKSIFGTRREPRILMISHRARRAFVEAVRCKD